jgi:hypothetical protein
MWSKWKYNNETTPHIGQLICTHKNVEKSTQEAEIRSVKFPGQVRKKVREIPSQEINWAQWHAL